MKDGSPNDSSLIGRIAEAILPSTQVSDTTSPQGSQILHRLWVAPRWQLRLAVLVLAAAFALVAWDATYLAGGTKSVYVHLGYLPILLTALFLGPVSTIGMAVAVTVLFGPLMPLDVDAGRAQQTTDWMIRGGFFAGIGVFTLLGTLLMKTHHKRREQALYWDPGTGLPTKPWFRDQVFPRIMDAGSCRLHVVVLNAAARIWAAFGQETVDRMGREAGLRLRKAGLPDGDVFRIGATEFGILERPETAEAIQTALGTIRDPVSVAGLTLFPDVTIGTTPLTGEDDPGLAVRRAIGAAEFAFERHRPTAVYSAQRDEERRERIALLADMVDAIGSDQIFLVYQPKVRLSDEVVVGAEALVRWHHPEKGLIPPGRFIPVVEQSPMMMDLTLDVVAKTFAQVNTWHQEGLDLPISVNISARDLSDDAFVDNLRQIANGWGEAPQPIEIEVTESAAFLPEIDGAQVFRSLREAGYRIAIDDYGTGQSSLTYLRSIPADYLKLDGLFVRHCATDDRDLAMVRSTVALAHDLGMEVIAEGVEDAAGIAALQQENCDYAQGYYYARPLPADEFARFAREHPGTGREAPE